MMQLVGKHRQRGVSGFGLLVLLGILGFSLWIFFTLFPLYMETMRLDSAMSFLEREVTDDKGKRSASAVQKILSNSLSVEGSNIPIYQKEVFNDLVEIKRNPYSVTLKHNQEVNLAANIWILVKYERTIEAP